MRRQLTAPDSKSKTKVYCGAYSLMTITGKNHEQAKASIRTANGWRSSKRIMGLHIYELTKAFRYCGLSMVKPRPIEHERWTLARWIRERTAEEKNQTFLIYLTRHYIIVSGNQMIDTFTKKPTHLDDSPHRRSRVISYWRIKNK